MSDTIKITKDLKFDLVDLMKTVDMSHSFTLRDVLRACMNSKIEPKALMELLHCNYIEDYWKEAESRPFTGLQDDRKMDYLELSWTGYKHTYKGKRFDSNGWDFSGAGKKGYITKDVLKYSKFTKKEKENYRHSFAIEFCPMYTLADYPIRLCTGLHITDYDAKIANREELDLFNKTIDMNPSITLIDLLYAIFWELSFCGSIDARNTMKEDIDGRVKEIKKALKEGRLNKITVPWEKVKKELKKKIKNIEKKEEK